MDIVDTWFDCIEGALAPVRKHRGEQLQDSSCASCCTGIAPDAKSNEMHQIKSRWHFMSDSKESSFNFVTDNCQVPEYFLVDAREICADEDNTDPEDGGTTKARCALRDFVECTFFIPWLMLDMLVAGISCQPYSAARTGRHSGTEKHPEAHLVWDFLRILFRCMPRFAVLEEVWGFCLPESGQDQISPLRRMLDFMEEKAYPYVVRVYVICTQTMLKWKRRRLYITFHHHDAGGHHASQIQEAMLKVWAYSLTQDRSSTLRHPREKCDSSLTGAYQH